MTRAQQIAARKQWAKENLSAMYLRLCMQRKQLLERLPTLHSDVRYIDEQAICRLDIRIDLLETILTGEYE